MQTTIATLLLITSAVILVFVVVDYSVTIIQQTLNTQNNPQLARLRNIENNILSQTDAMFNSTQPELPVQAPTPAP